MIHRKVKPKKIKTLLIDGEVLLKIGFYASKNTITSRGRVQTIYIFLNIIRMFYLNHFITKVVVFWEGANSRAYRQSYYPYYKKNREEYNLLTDDEKSDLQYQRLRIKQCLEELSIRQIEENDSEADDCIAYYTQNSPNERKIVFTNDEDLLQLLSDNTSVYLGDKTKKYLVTIKNFHRYYPYHHKNVALIKMISGDVADNISGISGVGEKTVLKLYPELQKEEKDVEWILEKTKELLIEEPTNNAVFKINEGETKWGTYGNDYFAVMSRIISLDPPHLTEDGIADLEVIKDSPIDPESRGGIKKVISMFMEDGIKVNTYNDDTFFEYWQPFSIIIKKELNFFKQSNITK